jgi:hypothetical protein
VVEVEEGKREGKVDEPVEKVENAGVAEVVVGFI